MLRLVLGLVVVLVLTLIVYKTYFSGSPIASERAAREGVVMPKGKNAQEMADSIRADLKKVEAQNRAAMDRTLEGAK